MNDTNDYPLRVGQVITYPLRQGSDTWSNTGVILEIDSDQRKVKLLSIYGPDSFYRTTLTRAERSTCVHPDYYNKAIHSLLQYAVEKKLLLQEQEEAYVRVEFLIDPVASKAFGTDLQLLTID